MSLQESKHYQINFSWRQADDGIAHKSLTSSESEAHVVWKTVLYIYIPDNDAAYGSYKHITDNLKKKWKQAIATPLHQTLFTQ